MSNASTAKNALRHVAATVVAPKGRQNTAKKQLFHFRFDPTPKPLDNPVNYTVTQAIAADPSHPYHIATQRRFAAFEPGKLHWTVKAPVDVSKKAIVRKWAIRRVKEAFRLELERSGWTKDGRATEKHGKQALKGALCVYLNKDAAVVTADWEQVRAECRFVLRKIVGLQAEHDKSLEREKKIARGGSGKRGSVAATETNISFKSLDIAYPLFSPAMPPEEEQRTNLSTRRRVKRPEREDKSAR